MASSTGSPTIAQGSGTVSVLYAGSLVNLMEHDLGPAFAKATGYTYQGYGAGSSAVANQIKGKVRRGDVFISANPDVNTTLMGADNGSWVSWYVNFAQAPLVIGYNPKSKFAADLTSKPWYQVLTESGFRLGCTDPKLDPKGKLTVQAIQEAAKQFNQPELPSELCTTKEVFPEEDLVGRLEAGQLDAGFFYANEAKEQNIPTISLSPINLSAQYTVTILANSPNSDGALAFVEYLLGSQGQATLKQHGLTPLAPVTVGGDASAVPAALRSLVNQP